jgi:hypothetical protein
LQGGRGGFQGGGGFHNGVPIGGQGSGGSTTAFPSAAKAAAGSTMAFPSAAGISAKVRTAATTMVGGVMTIGG